MSQGSPKSKLLSYAWLASEMFEVFNLYNREQFKWFFSLPENPQRVSPLIYNLIDSLKEFQNPQHTPITMKSMRVTPLAIV